MNNFIQAFTEGMGHIFCLDAMDHILFLLVLTACYDYLHMKKIFWLVTAFTIGHTITFIAAAAGMSGGVRAYAEVLIPITIIITAVVNFFKKEKKRRGKDKMLLTYILAIGFGAIHGLAIGSMIQMKLVRGGSFLGQLVGFNLGVEVAQILVVVAILILQLILMGAFRIRLNNWKNSVSGIAFGAALMILVNIL